MTIEFHCPHCDKLLKTPDDKAGVRANCPGCGESVQVPSGRELGEVDDSLSSASSPPATAGQAALSATGRAAGDATMACPMCGETIKAAATRCRYCGEELTRPSSRGRALAPHRGGLVLAFGILGWVVCFGFGIAAWVMGNHDLREMDAGRMDPAGEGLTRAGKIIGIVQCSLLLLMIPLYMVIAAIAFVANGR
jgi:predicted RNA-binding Zn-ribbon protein involved in translation (DUF1610 family)